mmetsp:Transcript_48082/g.120198  ORF Transcript_48082/g.120198 Transcript_48082/m.120198 type:complete len:256 (+) Transcript_48082:2538-3305(+)
MLRRLPLEGLRHLGHRWRRLLPLLQAAAPPPRRRPHRRVPRARGLQRLGVPRRRHLLHRRGGSVCGVPSRQRRVHEGGAVRGAAGGGPRGDGVDVRDELWPLLLPALLQHVQGSVHRRDRWDGYGGPRGRGVQARDGPRRDWGGHFPGAEAASVHGCPGQTGQSVWHRREAKPWEGREPCCVGRGNRGARGERVSGRKIVAQGGVSCEAGVGWLGPQLERRHDERGLPAAARLRRDVGQQRFFRAQGAAARGVLE